MYQAFFVALDAQFLRAACNGFVPFLNAVAPAIFLRKTFLRNRNKRADVKRQIDSEKIMR